MHNCEQLTSKETKKKKLVPRRGGNECSSQEHFKCSIVGMRLYNRNRNRSKNASVYFAAGSSDRLKKKQL